VTLRGSATMCGAASWGDPTSGSERGIRGPALGRSGWRSDTAEVYPAGWIPILEISVYGMYARGFSDLEAR
jgi:hypothetical protein